MTILLLANFEQLQVQQSVPIVAHNSIHEFYCPHLKIMMIIAGIMKISLQAINRKIFLWFVVNFPTRFLNVCIEFGPIC